MFEQPNPQRDRDRYTNAADHPCSAPYSRGQVAREHTPLVPVAHAAKACGALAAAGHHPPDYDPFGRCAAVQQ